MVSLLKRAEREKPREGKGRERTRQEFSVGLVSKQPLLHAALLLATAALLHCLKYSFLSKIKR